MKKDTSTSSGSKTFYSLKDVPAGLWVLGFVSMLMDVSSEMIHALLPVYLVTVLVICLALLIVADLTLGVAAGIASITFGVILWGLHMGFTQGLLATLVAD